ncbi:8-amino-7-oxononanoate synthase [Moritella sp. 24]|uniref:8-amino-7-oxononanoate synthase n=1 Tax=Moritella sp. 24 TaxID=2746230 RepID=UPI001BACCB0A|nr:8-amino-7-oxononanoate synthase [Moritella sp. 24]QUM76373.1 8-amino-7-oxononanoate synthase [Moritella sp. 24]
MAFEFITHALHQQKSASLLRTRVISNGAINFSANDYLGLATHPELIAAWQRGAAEYGVGSGGSFLVTGYTHAHAALEDKLADITGHESSLLFNSGYSANQALIKALLDQNDLLVQDKLNHASLIEAGVYSPATMKRFKHNDSDHLAQTLSRYRDNYTNSLVVTEGVFSMDGDQPNLVDIHQQCKAHDSWLLVDDAHGFGIVSQGQSLKKHNLSANDIALYMATFGKAAGVSGAFVSASKDVIDYLINFSKPYIYSTAMPAAMAVCIDKALTIMAKETWRVEHLNQLIAYFKQQCFLQNITLMPSDTAIQPLIIGDADKAMKISRYLASKGLLVKAIRPPTVPRGTSRLRITLSASHSMKDIDLLLARLKDALDTNRGGTA